MKEMYKSDPYKGNPEQKFFENEKNDHSRLVEKSTAQIERALTDSSYVTKALQTILRSEMTTIEGADARRSRVLELIDKNESVAQLLPDTLRDSDGVDEDGAAAYLDALAEALDQPPYRN